MARNTFQLRTFNAQRKKEMYEYLNWYKVTHQLGSGFDALDAIMTRQMSHEPFPEIPMDRPHAATDGRDRSRDVDTVEQ